MDFVAAAANLRSAAYGIPTQSLFDAKGMAGNIVHAVATTNAVISGLITLEAMKLLAEAPDACKVRGHCAHKLALFWRNLLEILPNGRNAERGRAHHDEAAGAGARRLQGERERCFALQVLEKESTACGRDDQCCHIQAHHAGGDPAAGQGASGLQGRGNVWITIRSAELHEGATGCCHNAQIMPCCCHLGAHDYALLLSSWA